MACRKHLENLKPKIADGTVVFGGGWLDEPVKEGEGPKINGSVMVIMADSKEEAMKFVESDIYTESDVWNLSKVSRILLVVFGHLLNRDYRHRYSHSGVLYARSCSEEMSAYILQLSNQGRQNDCLNELSRMSPNTQISKDPEITQIHECFCMHFGCILLIVL